MRSHCISKWSIYPGSQPISLALRFNVISLIYIFFMFPLNAPKSGRCYSESENVSLSYTKLGPNPTQSFSPDAAVIQTRNVGTNVPLP